LTGVPTGNDKFEDMTPGEQQVNAALQSRLPSGIVNHRHRLAIDLHLLPYYGQPSEAEVPYIYRANVAWSQVHRHYRYRFGIETSYRIKNQARIRSTTKNPVLRLLYVALAFILVNLWVYLLWQVVSATRRGGRRVFQERFPLKTMLSFIRQVVERHFPLVQAVFLPMAA
jgi:hypothetical protein